MKIKCPNCGTELKPEWLSKGGKKRWVGVSSKERSDMAHKGWETRRKNSKP